MNLGNLLYLLRRHFIAAQNIAYVAFQQNPIDDTQKPFNANSRDILLVHKIFWMSLLTINITLKLCDDFSLE